MTNSIAEFYIQELEDWKETISFYADEIEEAKEWLNGVLCNDTVIQLAETVEHHLNVLTAAKQSLHNLLYEIVLSEEELLKEQHPIKNEAITDAIKKSQKVLRQKMQEQEKKYLYEKYECDDFLAETITRQNKKIENK